MNLNVLEHLEPSEYIIKTDTGEQVDTTDLSALELFELFTDNDIDL